jgi:hypothetical protein
MSKRECGNLFDKNIIHDAALAALKNIQAYRDEAGTRLLKRHGTYKKYWFFGEQFTRTIEEAAGCCASFDIDVWQYKSGYYETWNIAQGILQICLASAKDEISLTTEELTSIYQFIPVENHNG